MRQQCRAQSLEILTLKHQLNLLIRAKRLDKAELQRLREQAEIDVKRGVLMYRWEKGDAA